MSWNMNAALAALVVVSFLAVADIFAKPLPRVRSVRALYGLACAAVIAAVCTVSVGVCNSVGSAAPIALQWGVRLLYAVCVALAGVLPICFLALATHHTAWMKTWKVLLAVFPILLQIILMICAPFTDWLLALQDAGQLATGFLYAPFLGVSALYWAACVAAVIRWHAALSRRQLFAVCAVCAVMCAGIAFEAAMPAMPIAYLCSVLALLCVCFAVPHSRFVSLADTRVLNRDAFTQMLAEKQAGGKKQGCILITIPQLAQFRTAYGEKAARELETQIAHFLRQRAGKSLCRLAFGQYAMLLNKNHDTEKMISTISHRFCEPWMVQPYHGVQRVRFARCTTEQLGATEVSAFALLNALTSEISDADAVELQAIPLALLDRLTREASIQHAVKNALENGKISLALRPIYAPTAHRVLGAEAVALLRDEPLPQNVSQRELLDAAQALGVAAPFGEALFEALCIYLKNERPFEQGLQSIWLVLSQNQWCAKNYARSLVRIAAEYAVLLEQLMVALPEEACMNDSVITQQNRAALQEVGARFAVHDYGGSTSRLDTLLGGSYAAISFDASIMKSYYYRESQLLTYLVPLCKTVGMETLVMGVETKQHTEMVTRLSITYLEGNYYANALPACEFLSFATSSRVAWERFAKQRGMKQ